MAYNNITKYQNTTNYSERDINKRFNLAEFNRIFEQNNLNFVNKNKLKMTNNDENEIQKTPIINACPENSKPNILFIITCIILILGILLLLFNNFISVD